MFHPRDWFAFHPLPRLISFVALFSAAMTLSHPIYLIYLAIVLCSMLFWNQEGRSLWFRYFRLVLPLTIFFMMIHIFFCHEGKTILWKWNGPSFLYFDLSYEEIFYNLVMGTQMILTFTCVSLFVLMPVRSRLIDFLFSRFPKISLTFSLVSILLSQFGLRLREAEDALKARGVYFECGNLKERFIKRIPLLKIMVLHALDGSWQTAEALEARGFGNPKKAAYFGLPFSFGDLVLFALGILLWSWLIIHWAIGEGRLVFYPVIGSLHQSFHWMSFLVFAFLVLSFSVFWVRSEKNDLI